MSPETWLEVAPASPFPLQHLPWGVFSTQSDTRPRIGVALGNYIINVAELQRAGLFSGPELSGTDVFLQESLNAFMGLGKSAWVEARATLQQLLSAAEGELRDNTALRSRAIVAQDQATLHLPATIGDYTDFYVSKHHAENVSEIFRGARTLAPQWHHLPVGYHGRASSIVVSGADVRRPMGQIKPPSSAAPAFGPCQALDFELELGAFIGPGNRLGEPIPLAQAQDHIFGLVLLNDWSARDIQAWEYVPLGPFNGKNWATQISPWIVTLDALERFLIDGPAQSPEPLPYLRDPGVPHTALDLQLTADIVPEGHSQGTRVTASNAKYMYWTFPQMVAHHTAGGCNLRPGDLLGSGTVSGPQAHERACLLELTRNGKEPVTLLDGGAGVERGFLEDGDTVVFTGVCERPDVPYRIGFGECRGTVRPPFQSRM